MSSRRRRIAGAAIALAALIGAGYSVAGGGDATVRTAVSRAWDDHIAAAMGKDLKAAMQIYAEDAIYVVPGFVDVRGRDAIEEIEAATLATADVLDAQHAIESLHVYGDIAYEIGTVTGPVRQHGREARTVRFHFMALWRRDAGGTWRIGYMVGQPERGDLPPGP